MSRMIIGVFLIILQGCTSNLGVLNNGPSSFRHQTKVYHLKMERGHEHNDINSIITELKNDYGNKIDGEVTIVYTSVSQNNYAESIKKSLITTFGFQHDEIKINKNNRFDGSLDNSLDITISNWSHDRRKCLPLEWKYKNVKAGCFVNENRNYSISKLENTGIFK